VLNIQRISVVARDGYPLHYSPFVIPLTGIYLDPRAEAAA
jgi:hypothetical protein